jgi:cephalosporin hydroxylase
VFDTVVEDLPSSLIKDRPWAKGDNPKTAVYEYLQELKDKHIHDEEGVRLQLEIDNDIQSRLMITVAPSGYLRRK